MNGYNGYDLLCLAFYQSWMQRLDRNRQLTEWIDERLWQCRKTRGRSIREIKRALPFDCTGGELKTALLSAGYRMFLGDRTDAEFVRCVD